MATINDVAKLAGVAVATVSRVLNNRGYISDKMRRKVHQAMEELDYYPNELSKSLLRGKSNIIGLIIPNVSVPFFAELTSYIEYFAFENGYKLLLCNSCQDSEKEKAYIDMLKRNQADGIILASHTLAACEYLNIKLPVVSVGSCVSENIPYVVVGAEVNYFKNKKHEEHIYSLFEENPDIDGVFSDSCMIAVSVIEALIKSGKTIPDDIEIIGYDDVNMSSLIMPSLTIARQSVKKISELVVENIINQIEDKEICYENIIQAELIEQKNNIKDLERKAI